MSPKVDPFAARAARKASQGAVPGQPSGLPDLPSSVSKPSGSSVVTFAQGRADKTMTLTDLPDPVETPAASGDLTEEEELILGLCMKGIRQFENAWWVMAKALANVNARRLYRKTHASFEAFAKDTLNKSRPTAYEEITAYAVGELMSARADSSFEENSNNVSARADIGKKAAIALNPITKAYGPEVAVAVHETIVDASGKAVPVKTLSGVVRQLPRPSADTGRLTEDELKALAREIVVNQSPAASEPGIESAATAVAELRRAVDQLAEVHRALAPAKTSCAKEEDAQAAEELLAEAERLGVKVAARARA
ncbi:hypothetical protein [Streptomyces clavifer]|uniref:hypothetical protein n=1 Tax=Streptomyces clavifer TaxID=68188 RepID=UPI003682B7CB